MFFTKYILYLTSCLVLSSRVITDESNTLEDVSLCVRREELHGPNDTYPREGSNTTFTCEVGEKSVHWQYQKPGEDKPRLLAQDNVVFVESELYSVTFSDVEMEESQKKRHCNLHVNDVTQAMNGTKYFCVYDGVSSCAQLTVAAIDSSGIRSHLLASYTNGGEKKHVEITGNITGLSATPGFAAYLNITDDHIAVLSCTNQTDNHTIPDDVFNLSHSLTLNDSSHEIVLVSLTYVHPSATKQQTLNTMELKVNKTADYITCTCALTGFIVAVTTAVVMLLLFIAICIVWRKMSEHPRQGSESSAHHQSIRLTETEPTTGEGSALVPPQSTQKRETVQSMHGEETIDE